MNQTVIANDPPVKCGYCGWLIGGCRNIMQHKCLEHFDEEKHLLNVDENFVVTLITRVHTTTLPNTEQNTEDLDDETNSTDEKLIEAVSERPGLYNIKLPVKERTKLKKQALWLEVTHMLGGTMTTDAIKKRWRYLRDRFIKARNKVLKYKPSGSAAEITMTGTQCFRFYEQMRFLNDSLPHIVTESNVESPTTSADSGCATSLSKSNDYCTVVPCGPLSGTSCMSSNDSLVSPIPPSRTSTPVVTKRRFSEDKCPDLRSALVNALQEQVPLPDAVDGFLIRVGEGLRRIPYRERCQLEIKILSMLMDIENRPTDVQ